MEKIVFLTDINEEMLRLIKQLNANSILLDAGKITENGVSLILQNYEGLGIYAVLDVFAGGDLLKKFPGAKAEEASKRPVSYEWYQGVCPNNRELRDYLLQEAKKLMANKNLKGLFLNFLHFPAFWMLPEPELFDTCYCETCIGKFKDFIMGDSLPESGEKLVEAIDGQYYLEWLNFKTLSITSFLEDVRGAVGNSDARGKLGVFAVPWKDKEYGSAIVRILGQSAFDFSTLADYVSPMLYYKTLGRNIEWVNDTIDYYELFGGRVLPSILFSQEALAMDQKEFEKLLNFTFSTKTHGVIIQDVTGVLGDSDKMTALLQKFSALD
ncbi:hypothetical protein HY419_00640 [candidate division WWE3 bacterium]|nr:hypothetical protein [candidate division WWE3 bacterium]